MRRALLVALVPFTVGCLSNHYVIPRRDLMAMSQQAPDERARSVRIIQEFSTSTGPPPAPETRAGAVVIVDPVPGPGVVGVGPSPRRRRGVGGRKGFSSRKLAKAKADDSKAVVVLAVLAAFGLAATEGARYDGWVQLHPMHPVHLYFPDGSYTWMPLAQLDPETARWATKAYVRDSEGPWSPQGRAPLDRVGLSYSVYLGGGQFISGDGSSNAGFMSHIQFGVFPSQIVGINLDIGLGWADNAIGDTIFDSRYALELDVLPIAAGPFHAGGFGQIGTSYRLEDGVTGEDRYDLMFGGGGLLQLEWTTRLALSARAGVNRLYGEYVADFGIGLSIY
jgi:hypothetical protein